MVIRLHRQRGPWVAVAALAAVLCGNASAQSGCEATSSNYDQRCSVTCKPGEVAACRDSPGSSSPDCFCAASADPRQPDLAPSTPRRSTPAPKRSEPAERGTDKN